MRETGPNEETRLVHIVNSEFCQTRDHSYVQHTTSYALDTCLSLAARPVIIIYYNEINIELQIYKYMLKICKYYIK